MGIYERISALSTRRYRRFGTERGVEGSNDDEKAKWISGSILLKLAYELRERGFLSIGPQDSDATRSDVTETGVPAWKDWRDELGHVWTVTMPSIAGITVSTRSPSTIAIVLTATVKRSQMPCQERRYWRGAFWLVVLEVHNTFSERHSTFSKQGRTKMVSMVRRRRRAREVDTIINGRLLGRFMFRRSTIGVDTIGSF